MRTRNTLAMLTLKQPLHFDRHSHPTTSRTHRRVEALSSYVFLSSQHEKIRQERETLGYTMKCEYASVLGPGNVDLCRVAQADRAYHDCAMISISLTPGLCAVTESNSVPDTEPLA